MLHVNPIVLTLYCYFIVLFIVTSATLTPERCLPRCLPRDLFYNTRTTSRTLRAHAKKCFPMRVVMLVILPGGCVRPMHMAGLYPIH